ncbi:MAG: dehydrogenase E1 component subunit alpha/beta [Planctomycetota bacterium]
MTVSAAAVVSGLPAHEALDRFPDELRTALLIRRTEQRLLGLYAEGKLFGTVHTCIGQEFSAVAAGRALGPRDTVFSNHRGHGHFLATGGTVAELIAEVMGKETGICRGRGGSQHLHKGRYYSNGIQGGIVPVSAGLAFGHRLSGDGAIAAVFIGDGTLGEGAVYESLNIASKWDLPLLVICENNLYAQSTAQTETLAGDICARAEAFGVDTRHGGTADWPALLVGMAEAVASVRRGSRPLFYRVDTFRLMAHSKGDDNRPPDYVQAHWERDPLVILERVLASDPRWVAIEQNVDDEIRAAVEAADAAPFGPPPVPPTPRGRGAPSWRPLEFGEERTVKSIQRGLGAALAADERVVVIGEDIESPYGGAFKCTQDLSARHPGRVRNTPISELAIMGIGNGLALAGYRAVVEIMFGDFVTLALDQWVNHAAKFAFMFADKVTVPLLVRTPMGGKRGYGATHSQSLERHVVGAPGTRVLCLHHRYPAADLLAAHFADPDTPTFLVENKILYGRSCSAAVPAGFTLSATAEPFPTVRLAPTEAAAVTIVALGGVGADAEEAAQRLFVEQELTVDLLLPTRLYPFDVEPILESVRATGRLLVVEEGQGFASVGAEIVATVAERLGPALHAAARVAAAECPIPAARPLEQACLPGVGEILAAASRLVVT